MKKIIGILILLASGCGSELYQPLSSKTETNEKLIGTKWAQEGRVGYFQIENTEISVWDGCNHGGGEVIFSTNGSIKWPKDVGVIYTEMDCIETEPEEMLLIQKLIISLPRLSWQTYRLDKDNLIVIDSNGTEEKFSSYTKTQF